MANPTLRHQLPVSLLSGFLGAGKTTLLNYILRNNRGLKIAVIVNEFGETGIDGDLIIRQDEDTIELSNGCLCCSVRGDLINGIRGLLERREAFDYLLIEASGMAMPGPIAQTFFLPEIEKFVRLDSIVCVADAENFEKNLSETVTAGEQIGFADIIVLNKCDLVPPDRADAIEKMILRLNPYVRIFRASHCEIDLQLLLDVGAFSLDKWLKAKPGLLQSGGNPSEGQSHDRDVQSVSFEFQEPLIPEKFEGFLEAISLKPELFRCKGILQFKGVDKRVIWHGVGNRFTATYDRPWGDEARSTRMVFIGKNLDATSLRKEIETCTPIPKASLLSRVNLQGSRQ